MENDNSSTWRFSMSNKDSNKISVDKRADYIQPGETYSQWANRFTYRPENIVSIDIAQPDPDNIIHPEGFTYVCFKNGEDFCSICQDK